MLSDHGGAWSGGYQDTGPPSTSQLTIADMRDGILAGMQRGGVDKFEFIDHDSCLMASYEAASALGPLTKNLVASEEVTFGDSTLDLEAFASLGEDVSGEQWGLNNIEGYAATADGYDGIGEFTALSVTDGEAMERVDEAMESFADVAIDNMETIAPELARARSRSLEFMTALLGEDGGMSVVDLGDFLRQIENVPEEVLVARDAVFAAIDGAVLHQVTRKATEQATGLNVFFPRTPQQAEQYVAQNIAPPGWNRLLESYAQFAEGSTGDTGGVAFTSDTADVIEIGPEGIRIAAQLETGDEANVAGSETQVYTEMDGRQALAAVLPAYLNSGGQGQVQGVWNFSMTTLVTGKQRGSGVGGLPGPVRRAVRLVPGALHGTRRQPDRRRDPGAALQRGRDRGRLGRRHQPGRPGRHRHRGRGLAHALPHRAVQRRLPAGAVEQVGPGQRQDRGRLPQARHRHAVRDGRRRRRPGRQLHLGVRDRDRPMTHPSNHYLLPQAAPHKEDTDDQHP